MNNDNLKNKSSVQKALAVANEFILLATEKGAPLTHMKLQKLMYFAHGWYLGLTGSPLIKEEFEAWEHGPVIPSIYNRFKDVGRNLILAPRDNGFNETPRIENFEKEFKPFFERIWDVFGKYTGNQLSAMTHFEGSPWYESLEAGDGCYFTPISNRSIKKYFKEMV